MTDTATDITLVVNSNDYTGWYESDFQRSMEDLCGRFALSVFYDQDMKRANLPVINDGDKCQLYLGKHLLMTGHIDAANPFYNREDIGMKIEGRDLSADIVDSSARFASGEWNNADFLRIANDICSSTGIKVIVEPGVDIGKSFAAFRIESGETRAQVISRAASYRGLLVFPGEDGNLLVTRASKQRAPTILKSGMNIISAERVGGMQNRFYSYRVQGQGDAIAFGVNATDMAATAIDKQVRKSRELIVCAESAIDPASYQQRADTTVKQRRGRSAYYIYSLDDWTHEDGSPWLINKRVDVVDPFMKLNMDEFITASVQYKANRKDGKTCELTLKRPVAFDELPAPESEIAFGQ